MTGLPLLSLWCLQTQLGLPIQMRTFAATRLSLWMATLAKAGSILKYMLPKVSKWLSMSQILPILGHIVGLCKLGSFPDWLPQKQACWLSELDIRAIIPHWMQLAFPTCRSWSCTTLWLPKMCWWQILWALLGTPTGKGTSSAGIEITNCKMYRAA